MVGMETTAIQEFYRGANVLITGGTGFMGKVLVEKLLRACPQLSNIYLLVRSKRGQDAATRMHNLVQNSLFEKLRKQQPDFPKKIRAVEGDCSQPGLALSPGDRQLILERVNIVFHVAATVRFDEKLGVAVATNVRGTRDLLLLCRDRPNIKAMVYVSTAYSHCYRQAIDEEFYDPPLTCDRILQLVECLDENTLTKITPTLLGPYPNTYCFTKAIAEDAVRTLGKGMPVGVFRPSIVISTKEEPVPGWIDNLNGPIFAALTCVMGINRTMIVDRNLKSDMIPCDMATSALIASAWDIHERHRIGSEDTPLYNYVSTSENVLTWDNYISHFFKQSWRAPYNDAMWVPVFKPTTVHFLYKIYVFILHTLPAILMDTVLFCTGHEPRMMNQFKKVNKYTKAMEFFTTNEWKFSNHNVKQLLNKISDEDRKSFNFDLSNINYEDYFNDVFMGIRTFLLKQDPKTIPQAISRERRLFWLHQCLLFSLVSMVIWLCWFVTNPILRLVKTIPK